MKLMDDYYMKITGILTKIKNEEEKNIQKAVQLLANVIEGKKLIYVFGTGGHSIMGAMEIFWRAGGLVPINAIFPPGVSVTSSHPNTERVEGYAKFILRHYGVGKDDVIIISNVNGINPLTIETAIEAKRIGAKIIAVTSRDFANSVPKNLSARHSSNKNLHELGDIVIDLHVPYGDSIVEIENFEQKVGASSTFAVCFALNSVSGLVVEELLRRGVTPPVWKSANVKGGDESNKKYVEEYINKIPHLYRV